jgi:hypothetical protein
MITVAGRLTDLGCPNRQNAETYADLANMNIATNLNGRLRNTSLPLSHGLLPLFEAVINSIHGLEEAAIPAESGWIRVSIQREQARNPLDDGVEDSKGGQPLPAATDRLLAAGDDPRNRTFAASAG